jgi:tetratricopeptide (TPR) repeat protein
MKNLRNYFNLLTICLLLFYCQNAFGQDNFNQDHFNKEGLQLLSEGKFQESIEKFQAAIKTEQKCEFYYNLGLAFYKSGNLPEAEKAFKNALAINAKYWEAWRELARVLHDEKQYIDAKLAFENALKYQSHTKPILTGLGKTSFSTSEKLCDKTIAEIEEPTATTTPARDFPGQGNQQTWAKACGLYDQANILAHEGKLDQAILKYRAAIIIYPYDADFFHNLGLALKKKGAYQSAVDAYKRALELSPSDWDTWYNLGSALFELKQYAQARQAFTTANKYRPTNQGKNNIDSYLAQLKNKGLE